MMCPVAAWLRAALSTGLHAQASGLYQVGCESLPTPVINRVKLETECIVWRLASRAL